MFSSWMLRGAVVLFGAKLLGEMRKLSLVFEAMSWKKYSRTYMLEVEKGGRVFLLNHVGIQSDSAF